MLLLLELLLLKAEGHQAVKVPSSQQHINSTHHPVLVSIGPENNKVEDVAERKVDTQAQWMRWVASLSQPSQRFCSLDWDPNLPRLFVPYTLIAK